MADFNSSLPIRTESAGDVAVKVVDKDLPSQQLAVTASGEAKVILQAALPAGANQIGSVIVDSQPALSHSNDSVKIGDGTDFLLINNDGSINVVGSITVSTTDLDIRDLNASQDSVKIGNGSGNFAAVSAAGELSVAVTQALPAGANNIGSVNIKDSAGVAFGIANPLPVYIQDSIGTEVNDHATATVAAGATSAHDYTVTALKSMRLSQIVASASGKLKIEVKVESAVASGTFVTKFVQFNSTASPNVVLPLNEMVTVAAGVKIRVVCTNKDNTSQDVFSTICGHEV